MVEYSVKKGNLFLKSCFSKLVGLFLFTLVGYISIYLMLISEKNTSITGSFISVPAESSLTFVIPLIFSLLLIGVLVFYFCKKKD